MLRMLRQWQTWHSRPGQRGHAPAGQAVSCSPAASVAVVVQSCRVLLPAPEHSPPGAWLLCVTTTVLRRQPLLVLVPLLLLEPPSWCLPCRLLLNCVGPFRHWGEVVFAACAQAGTDYLDICGEPGAGRDSSSCSLYAVHAAGHTVLAAARVWGRFQTVQHSTQWHERWRSCPPEAATHGTTAP